MKALLLMAQLSFSAALPPPQCCSDILIDVEQDHEVHTLQGEKMKECTTKPEVYSSALFSTVKFEQNTRSSQ